MSYSQKIISLLRLEKNKKFYYNHYSNTQKSFNNNITNNYLKDC